MCYYEKNNLIRQLIHRFKYYQEKEIGIFLAEQLAESLIPFHKKLSFDLVIPIPLHPKKLAGRGYNQAAIISQIIGERLKIKHAPHTLKRSKITKTQTRKSRQERAFTSVSPFEVNAKIPAGIHILLVDDIITTGNTLESACRLLTNQNIKVSVATLAFTLKH